VWYKCLIATTVVLCAYTASLGLIGDINSDGYVNVGDLQLLVAKWGSGPGYAGREDINGDGFVNVGDLQLLVAHWGQSDNTPPAAVSNLATSSPTSSSITLTWTAPSDPDSACTGYDIRYSPIIITVANFSSATQVSGAPAPASPGTNQTMVVSGLSSNTTYYFAMKTSDAVPNWSDISNVPSATTLDNTPPAAISNLSCSNITAGSIQLNWTAPSDPDSACTAYDIRYSTSTITAGNFSSATQVSGAPAPASGGTNQNMVVSGLSSNVTYYFAMKTSDAVPNWSAISNVPSAKQTIGTVTFQQGLNGYSGCQDTFVNTGQYGEDSAGVCYGLNRFLVLNSEHYENF
jgi:phosphodiesterase/alkaline phosphatase D-like protein